MTQLVCLCRAIKKRTTSIFHAEASLHAQLHGATIKPLDEILGEEVKESFDEKTDEFLEKMALKKLYESRAKHGRQ